MPREPPAALPSAKTAERAKNKGVGFRLEPMITYSFYALHELPPSSFFICCLMSFDTKEEGKTRHTNTHIHAAKLMGNKLIYYS